MNKTYTTSILPIAENIKKIRELRNLTRGFVAGELDMSVSGYGKIERGEVDPAFTKIVRIANVLQVNILNLLHFDIAQIFEQDEKTMLSGHSNADKEKHIEALEAEVTRLRNLVGKS